MIFCIGNGESRKDFDLHKNGKNLLWVVCNENI